jgi:2',3'-cyclic-nucleotide 2'-phosphodiesterase (5'-nucleotidase family)
MIKIMLFIFIFIVTLLADNNHEQNLIIFYTNDLHGGITEQEADFLNPDFPPILGGGAAAANIIFQARKQAEKTDDIVIVLDAGDIFQGTPVGTKTEGQAIIEYMNEVGYDAVTAGNHDFDLGKDVFIKMTEKANFPILSANLIDISTNKVLSFVKPYTIIEKKGLKIGVFGLSTEATEQMSFPEHIKGLDFSAEIPAAHKAVNELRKQNVDLVIAVVHMGLPYDTEEGYAELKEANRQNINKETYLNAMELANQVEGIDILFGGHIHRGYNEPWEDPKNHTLCFQNYGNGGNLGMVLINIDKATNTISGYDLPGRDSGLLLLTSDEFLYNKEIHASIKQKQSEVEKGYDEIIGNTEFAITRSGSGDSPMSNLICDAMVEATNADFSMTNYGGIRAEIKTGPITPRNIFKVLPFGNSIVVMQMKGKLLKQIVEQKLASSNRGMAVGGGIIKYDKSNPAEIINSFIINGQPLNPDKIYRIATTDYLAEGNSGFGLLAEIEDKNIAYTGIILRNAVTEYIQKNSPLKIRTEIRTIKTENESSALEDNRYYASLNFDIVYNSKFFPQEETEITEPQYNQTIGSASADLTLSKSGESPLNNFICDVMRIAMNAEFAFMNFGDITSEIPAGPIKHLDMFRLIPFDRKIVVIEIEGVDLKKLVEQSVSGFRFGMAISGGKVEYDPYRDNFNRLTYFEVADNPIYPARMYRVATTDYLTQGNAGFEMLQKIEKINIIPTETLLREVIEQFIKDNSPIDTKTDGRWLKK